jgi:hypothetical protein
MDSPPHLLVEESSRDVELFQVPLGPRDCKLEVQTVQAALPLLAAPMQEDLDWSELDPNPLSVLVGMMDRK